MEEVQTLYEKKIDAMMCKMFGDADSQLKAITKMTLMNNVLTDDMKQTLIALREQQLKEAEMINEEMTMTLDASGNVVPIELSPRQQDIKITYHDTVEEDDRDN
jgi:uncharacterized protein YuzE